MTAAVQSSLGRKQRLKQGRPKPFAAAINVKDAAQIDRAPSKELSNELQSVVGSLEQSLTIDTSASNAGVVQHLASSGSLIML